MASEVRKTPASIQFQQVMNDQPKHPSTASDGFLLEMSEVKIHQHKPVVVAALAAKVKFMSP
jgi:hypothetical protein